MTRAQFFGACFGLTLAVVGAGHQKKPTPIPEPVRQGLTIRQQQDRVVLAWSGPVETTMRDALVAAVNTFKADPRRMVIALNSPGGSVARGREVVAAMRGVAQMREIDTLIDKGAVCASMCVPIYLLGSKRMADPDAHLMFHEVSLDMSAYKNAHPHASTFDPTMVKVVETAATDRFFDRDLQARGVDAYWLAAMRSRIAGHDIWMSARQLVDERSGVIDTLVETRPE